MKLAQALQTSSEFALIDVRTLSKCSTFTSSDAIHRVSSGATNAGSRAADNRVKYDSLATERSGDNSGFLGQRQSRRGTNIVTNPSLRYVSERTQNASRAAATSGMVGN